MASRRRCTAGRYLKVALLLTYQQPNEHVLRQLCRMERAGAAMHYSGSGPWMVASTPYYALRYLRRDGGHRPYLLPPGGSTPLGAVGYVNAGLELAAQVREGLLPEPQAIVLPVGSGGTAAGLALGLGIAGLRSKVVGVAVTRAPTTWAITVKRLAIETASLLRKRGARDIQANLADVEVADEWLGVDTAVLRGRARRRVRCWRRAWLRLDPTYTGKTMAALLAMCRRRELRGSVLYWHTYDAITPKDERPAPRDYLRLPEEFRQFCPAS